MLSGELVRHGGVVRNLAGQVVKHLDEVPIPVKNQESSMLRIADMLKKHKVGIIIGFGVVIVAGGVALLVADKNKKSKQNSTPAIPDYIEDYNTALCAYLDAVRNGSLDIDIINCLLINLDRVKENIYDNKIKIDFSTEQLETLVNLMFDYTRKLAEANSIEVSELNEPVFDSAEKAMLTLQHYLQTQKQIFEEAA